MFDAVHVVVSAVRELNRSQEIGVKPLACTSANIWPHGTSLMNYLRMVSRKRGGLRGRSSGLPQAGALCPPVAPLPSPPPPPRLLLSRGLALPSIPPHLASLCQCCRRCPVFCLLSFAGLLSCSFNSGPSWSPSLLSPPPPSFPLWAPATPPSALLPPCQVEYDGLTGRVEFNSKGQRTNYTLRILEKARQGHREVSRPRATPAPGWAGVRVGRCGAGLRHPWAGPGLTAPSLPQIGVWYSNRTLAMNATTLDINLSQTLANKTLVVTTILVSGPSAGGQ